ncbi:MatE_and transmembrane domain-containing protein [Hexamita inflata]|uniref:MatE and transmembrane domain-containing protein n=1 Tax=Hexamita inflata TaxID=28002 RepID=A0AA86PCN8_9EUKA|nr:MatE and transmembrane domain-containing protein [Hexamita inflata]
MNDSSIHSTQLSKQSQDPIQIFHSKLIMQSISNTLHEILLQDTLLYIAQTAVYLTITHNLYQIEDNQVGLIDCLVAYVVLNLITIIISDSVIEAGFHYVSQSLEAKKYNASKIYFTYTFIFGFLTTVIISLVILLGVQKEFITYILWRQQTKEEKKVYRILIIAFTFAYFPSSFNKLMRAEGRGCMTLNYFGLVLQFYIVTMTVFFTQLREQNTSSLKFVPCLIIPVLISAILSLFQMFHLFSKKFKYNNTLFIEKALFKPLRSKVVLEISKLSLYNLYQNVGDALIHLFTVQILSYSDVPVVIFTLIQLELTNALNKSISSNLSTAFRINMQLKRYDRVFQFYLSSFPLLLVNLAFQVLTFSIRNLLYKIVFDNSFDSSLMLFHGSVDGLLGTFNAFSTAVMRSDPHSKVGFFTGSFKLLLSIGFYLTAKYTNIGNSHYSSMLYLYKYCTDLVGFGLFILYLQKFYILKKNSVEELIKEPKKLVLQELHVIEISGQSEPKETKESKTNELSWALEEKKGDKGE